MSSNQTLVHYIIRQGLRKFLIPPTATLLQLLERKSFSSYYPLCRKTGTRGIIPENIMK